MSLFLHILAILIYGMIAAAVGFFTISAPNAGLDTVPLMTGLSLFSMAGLVHLGVYVLKAEETHKRQLLILTRALVDAQRSNDFDDDPPRADQYANPPRADQNVTPPRADQDANPPRADQGVNPPRADQGANPPRADRAFDNPRADRDANSPRADRAITPPRADRAFDEHNDEHNDAVPNLRPQPLYDQNAFDDVDEVSAQAATAAEAAAEESDIKTLRSLVTQLYSGKSARKSAEKTTPRHAETFKNDPPRFKNAQAEMTQPAERVKPATPRLSKSLSEEELLTKINDSITQKRISILLQPVASLPGRHILFQECFTRLYDEDGMEIGPERFLAVAVSQGLMPTIDQLSLYFLLEYLTKIVNRQENNSYFCNISAHTIGNPVFFKAFLSQLEANPSVTAKLIIEISQTDIEQGGVALLQSIKNLKQVGFRLSMDQVFHAEHGIDLALRLGFDFIKLRAPTLMVYLDNSYQSRDDANQAVKQWQNQGLAIIAERVESEIALKELSEYDVNFAQGYLLGPPVKME